MDEKATRKERVFCLSTTGDSSEAIAFTAATGNGSTLRDREASAGSLKANFASRGMLASPSDGRGGFALSLAKSIAGLAAARTGTADSRTNSSGIGRV